MNAIVSLLLSRIVGAAVIGGAAAVPSVASGQPAALPSSLDELVVQLIMAVAGIGIFYARRKLGATGVK